MSTVRCDNCEWTGPKSRIRLLEDLASLGDRLTSGSQVPDGECPECGAFVYLARVEYHRYEIWYFPCGVGQGEPYFVEPHPRDKTCLAYSTLGDAQTALRELTKETAPSDRLRYRIAEIDECLVEEDS